MNDLSGHFAMIARLVDLAVQECSICARGRKPAHARNRWMHGSFECATGPTWDRIQELEAESAAHKRAS